MMLSESRTLDRADEFDFPEFAGLINKEYEGALRLRLFEIQNPRRGVDIAKGALRQGVEVFSQKAAFPKSDALLVVSPWVRVDPGTPEAILEELGRCFLSISFYGISAFGRRPIGPYLLSKGQSHDPAYPGSLCHIKGVYPGAEIDSEGSCHPKRMFGAFLPTDTPISVTLSSNDGGPSEGLRITAGLTAARYTSGPDWDVVDFGEGKHPKG